MSIYLCFFTFQFSLPGPEALLQRGKEDQTKMIRYPDGKIICYQWSGGKWNPLGDVVGAADETQGSSGKKLYDGKEYDYVFSVDISDTLPALKLPYNSGEDPWVAAQKFIHKNDLPQTYLDQVADFIIKNAESKPIETTSAVGYQDPFTGGSRYVPGSDAAYNSGAGNVDPFTGGSSYTTPNQQQINVNFAPRSGQNTDPFTGGSSYSSNGTKPTAQVKHFPYSQYMLLDTCDPTKVLVKLK